jgi:hypothetical protein
MPPLELGKATSQWTRGALGHSNDPRSLSKTPIKVELKNNKKLNSKNPEGGKQ